MKMAAKILSKPTAYRRATKWMRRMLRLLPRPLLYLKANVWGKQRELPEVPKQSFKDWYKENGDES